MANSIWNPGISASNPTLEMIVNQQSQNTEGNYSVLAWSLILHRPSSISSSSLKNYNVIINNITVASGSTTIGGSGDKLIASGTTVLYHNPDGTKVDVPFSFYMDIGLLWSGVQTGNASGSGDIDLTPIPRATTPSLNYSAREMGQVIRITTNPAIADFSHKIYYSFTGISKTLIVEKPAGNQYHDWTIPLETLAPKIPSALSGIVTITVDTYSGGTFIGTKSVTFTATVPDYQPTASLNLTGINLYSTYYVQSKSKVSVTISADGLYGSTISTYRTTVNGSIYNTANLITEVLATAGINTIETIVTDSRGKTRTITQNITVQSYANPKAISLNVARCLVNGTLDEEGGYAKITIQSSISSILSTNTKETILKYKLKSSGIWTIALSNTIDYLVNTSIVFPADTNEQYDVMLEVNDYFNSGLVTRSADIAVAFTLMDFNSDGKGMAIGKVAEGNGVLDIRGNVNIDGSILLKNTAGILTSIFDLILPVGKIEMTDVNINPGARFPGTTWIAWGIGKFPVGVDPNQTEFNIPGKTGGAKVHALTSNEMPIHTHTQDAHNHSQNAHTHLIDHDYDGAGGSSRYTVHNPGYAAGGVPTSATTATNNPAIANNQNAGGGQAHNNLPPYETCYYWKRTA